MIDQSLVAYIKQQLELGSTKEKISSELSANGWSEQDIKDGFDASIVKAEPSSFNTGFAPINVDPEYVKPKVFDFKKIFLIILIVIFLIGATAFFVFRDTLINMPFVQSFLNKDTATVAQNEIIPTSTEIPLAQEQTNQIQEENLPIENNVISDNEVKNEVLPEKTIPILETYRNEQYKFEVKYLSKYILSEKRNESSFVPTFVSLVANNQESISDISIFVSKGSIKNLLANNTLLKKKEEKFGNNTFISLESKKKNVPETQKILFIENAGALYTIQFSNISLNEEEKEILSSLSFFK